MSLSTRNGAVKWGIVPRACRGGYRETIFIKWQEVFLRGGPDTGEIQRALLEDGAPAWLIGANVEIDAEGVYFLGPRKEAH